MTDELKEVILKLQGNEGKIRTILNKADQVSQWELICVYRTITWYMSKDLRRPALISSFWKELFNVQSKEARRHLEQEKNQTRLTCCAKSALLLKGKRDAQARAIIAGACIGVCYTYAAKCRHGLVCKTRRSVCLQPWTLFSKNSRSSTPFP